MENYKRSQRQQTLVKMQGLKKNMDRKAIEKQISKQEKQWEEDAHRVARKSMFVDLQSDELEQARKALEEQRREAELAREEAARLKEELAKDQEVIAQQEDKIKGLEGMMEKLREEAEQRRELRREELAATEDKLKGLEKQRRNTLKHKDFDEEQYKKEIEALRGKLKALQSQLNVDYENLDWDGTLEQAEAKMKELMPKMMSDNEKEQQEAQQEFDQWDQVRTYLQHYNPNRVLIYLHLVVDPQPQGLPRQRSEEMGVVGRREQGEKPRRSERDARNSSCEHHG